jgi:hypothetical protein
VTYHSPFDQPSYGKKAEAKKKTRKKACKRAAKPKKKAKKVVRKKKKVAKKQLPTKKQAGHLASLQNKIDKIMGEDWGYWTGERILYELGHADEKFGRAEASQWIDKLEKDLASLQEWVKAGKPKGWVVGQSERGAKKRAPAKKKKKKKKRKTTTKAEAVAAVRQARVLIDEAVSDKPWPKAIHAFPWMAFHSKPRGLRVGREHLVSASGPYDPKKLQDAITKIGKLPGVSYAWVNID